MLQEFKKFIAKGNVMEMAVGLILATYFGAIVKSLVNDIILPPIGYAIGGVDFTELKWTITEAAAESAEGAGDGVEEVAIYYGNFINEVLTFFIVAFCVFLVVRAYNKMKERLERKAEEAPEPAAAPIISNEEKLLMEIRDALRDK